MAPTSYAEVRPVADRYKAGLPTILSLRAMSVDDAQHSIDFFTGMQYALDGSVKKKATGIFLITPAGATLDQNSLEQTLAELR